MTMPKGKTWSKDEIRLLNEYSDKLPIALIASKLGRTRYAVYQKMRVLGIYKEKNGK